MNTENKANTKKILLGITKGTWGGAQKNVYDIATALKNNNAYEVVVVAGTPGALTEKLSSKNISVHSINTLGRDVKFFQEVRSFFSFLSILKKEHPEIIHLHSPKMGGLGALAGRIYGISRIIYTPHGWVFYEKRFWLTRALLWFFSWITALLCTHIIVLSEDDRKKTTHALGFSKKIIVISNGVSCEAFAARADAWRALGITNEKAFHVGTIAELHNNKGLSFALRAFAALPDTFFFHVIGTGDEKKSLENLARELDITKRIYWHGFVENASVYLQAFDAFLLPSIKEGLPYVLLEAGCAGVPVVATNVGSIAEIIKNEETGLLIPSGNSEAIQKALITLSSNALLAERCANNLKELTTTRFSVEEMIRRLTTLYRS